MLQVGLILLKILKIIGIILLALICMILLLVLFVLAAPIQYEVRGAFDDKWECKFKASARIYLLLHLIKISFGFKAMKWKLTVKVLFFQIMKKCGQIGKDDSADAGTATDSGAEAAASGAVTEAESEDDTDGTGEDAGHAGQGGSFGGADESDDVTEDASADLSDLADESPETDELPETDEADTGDESSGLVMPDSSDTWYTDAEPDDEADEPSGEAAEPSDEANKPSDEAAEPFDEAGKPSDEAGQDEITDEKLDQMLDELDMDSDSDADAGDSADSILDKAAKVYAFIQRDSVKKLIGRLEKGLMKILRHLIPDSLDVDAEIGQEDPYKDGQIAQYAVILHTLYPNHIDLRANFDEKVMKGKVSLRGKIIPGYIIVKLIGMAIVVLLNKDCRALIKKILKGDD